MNHPLHLEEEGPATLQAAAQRILPVTEEELRRIILDIHDGPVQQLFAALSQISVMQGRCSRGEAISTDEWEQHLARLSGLLSQTLQEIRTFLGSFSPPEFTRTDLAVLIEGLVIQHETFTGCQVDLAFDYRPVSLSLPTKIALYRICQEALSNAYRHSGAREQGVMLATDGEMVILEVRDQGRGFVPPPLSGPEATEREEHIGLRGMRERVGLVGGDFELHSAPNKGTRIVVRVPVR